MAGERTLPDLMKSWYKALTTSSTGVLTGSIMISDKVPESVGYIYKASALNYSAGVEVDLTGKSLTSYRFKPDVDMRVAEDASDQTEADTWLQVGAVLANGQWLCRPVVLAGEWSDWRVFPEGNYLTNLYFSTDAAGTGKIAILEAE